MKKREVELLAPAGSYECLLAALKSGADAVYVGGDKFGARAFANNFGLDELKDAIDLVHLCGKKLFLTINTLLKEDELNKELYDYIYPLYLHGLDAVIVQDFGVLSFIKEYFPNLPIHASTQMTVTSEYGVRMLEELGVERVVTSRELSLQEVEKITSSTKLEIESFVHGALCYGYSGQCIYSSLVGGRSGNRGQCAQPCRLPYDINGKTAHFMSLKDICTLEHVDKLIDSGVYSFKIEGRMKKPEYVASVTSMYRKYIDIYQNTGKLKVSEQDMDMLKDVFSRGEFSTGYWMDKNGPQMVTFDKPSHTGVPILKVTEQNGNKLKVKALKYLNKGDVIDIPKSNDDYTFGKDYKIGDSFELNLRKGVRVPKDTILFRTRNNSLLSKIDEELNANKLQQGINGKICLKLGEAASYTVSLGNTEVTVCGDLVERAQNQAATKEQVEKQLNKMGTSKFCIQNLSIVMDENLFVPVQMLKELRRKACDMLFDAVVNQYRRFEGSEEESNALELTDVSDYELNKGSSETKFTLAVETVEQLRVVTKGHCFERVYIDYGILEKNGVQELNEYIIKLKADVYISLPHILRQKYLDRFLQLYKQILTTKVKGVLVRNIECYQFLRENNYSGEILLDNHIHIYSNRARMFWIDKGVEMVSSSPELTGSELAKINHNMAEMTIYGKSTMMVSAQCLQKTSGGCTGITGFIEMIDRKNVVFPIKNNCSYCYNLIFNYVPTYLLEEREALKKISANYLRVALSDEDKNGTSEVLSLIKSYREGEIRNVSQCTLGNFRRGIK